MYMVTITQTYRPTTDDVRYRVRVGPELILELIVTAMTMQTVGKKGLSSFLLIRFEHSIFTYFNKSICVSKAEIAAEVKKAVWVLTQEEVSPYTTGFNFPVYEKKSPFYGDAEYLKKIAKWKYYGGPGAELSYNKRLSEVNKLPGLREVVKHPVDGRMLELETAIINLNDSHQWTREQIADWLETLDVDLRFK